MMPDARLRDYDYDLPQSLIAQFPAETRDASRLLVYRRSAKRIEHRRFYEIEEFLRPGDCLVVNDSKVIPARLLGRKEKKAKPVEFLWLGERDKGFWQGLLRGRHQIGSSIVFGEGFRAEVFSKNGNGATVLKIPHAMDALSFLKQFGKVPLPPYIERDNFDGEAFDRERYQTLFACKEGSVAAPTAGLHFSNSLKERLTEQGIQFASVTLHVGLGTFQPLRHDEIWRNKLHSEPYEITDENALIINRALQEKRRLVAVGTTTARALESSAGPEGFVRPGKGVTELFIYPPYSFKAVRNLVTNFHLPKSSLLMLVAALIGPENLFSIYRTAIENKYRFYSYGDAMLVLADSV